jgi:hypothetical protein
MLSNRYTVVIADRRTGVVRRFTIGLRPPWRWSPCSPCRCSSALGAALKAKAEVAGPLCDDGRARARERSFRGATEALTGQIQGAADGDLRPRRPVPRSTPTLQSAMDKLPAVVKNRAMGGGSAPPDRRAGARACQSPENTFGLLRDLLQGIESRLRRARRTSTDATPWRRRRPRSGRRTAGCRRARAAAAIRSPASATTIPASTSRPTAARRSTPRPTATVTNPLGVQPVYSPPPSMGQLSPRSAPRTIAN